MQTISHMGGVGKEKGPENENKNKNKILGRLQCLFHINKSHLVIPNKRRTENKGDRGTHILGKRKTEGKIDHRTSPGKTFPSQIQEDV